MDFEALKKELFDHVDESIKTNLAALVGEEVSARIAEKVKEVRLDRHFGLAPQIDDDTKIAFAKDIRAISRNEKAAYLGSSDQTGGYLIPTEVHNEILRIAATVGLIMRDARRWAMSTDELEIPRFTGSVMQGAYQGEDTAGSETQSDIGVARLQAKYWQTIFRVSNILLADANVNVFDWLVSLAGEGLAYRIDREGFVGGTFAGSPFTGLLSDNSGATVHTMATGATGFEDVSLVEASDAIATLPTAALSKAAWYMHRTVWAKLRSRSTSGVFEYGQTGLAAYRRESGIQPAGLILDYPVYVSDVLPAYSTSAVSTKFALFANLELALAWGDRGPMEIAKSDSAVIGGVSTFERNQQALRLSHRHAIVPLLPAAAAAIKTAAS